MEFDISQHIGEKNLQNQIMDRVRREIDLMFFRLETLVQFVDGEFDTDELETRLNNISSHSVIQEPVDIDTMIDNIEDTDVLDNLVDVDNLIMEFKKDIKITNRDKKRIKEYYKKQLREFRIKYRI